MAFHIKLGGHSMDISSPTGQWCNSTKDSYQGTPSGMPPVAPGTRGALAAVPPPLAGPQRLKPFRFGDLTASLKRCPDTNRFSNCTTAGDPLSLAEITFNRQELSSP
jgi:hypothetical protein